MPIKVLNEFLPNAEETRLGAIKVGDTLEIDQEEGVLNVDPTSVIGLYYSNCITEIAQDVKLEIVSGNAILKAGSRVYIPAGNNNTFNLYTTETDLQLLYIGSLNGQYFIQLHADSVQLVPEYLTIQSGDTFPENPTSLQKFYKSDENLVYSYDATRTVWKPANISLPLAIVSIENGEVKDIIQVFNGASYFGHHAFILPGLKGAAADGISDKGGVKSIDIKIEDIIVYDLAENNAPTYNNLFLYLDNELLIWRERYRTVEAAKELQREQYLVQYSYTENKDYYWDGSTYLNYILLPIVEVSLKDSTVTYFRILQPLRIATVSDVKESTDSFLFDYKWADHIPNKLSWLRADTFSWQDGNIYKAAYNHLAYDFSHGSVEYDTIGSYTVAYILAPDGHKDSGIDQGTIIQNIYNATGISWYYILDESNKRFKLPRTKFGFTGIRDGVGRYVAPGLPDPDVDVIYRQDSTSSGVYRDQFGTDGWTGAAYSNTGGTDEWMQSSKDKGSQRPLAAIFTNSIYGASSTVQPPATQMYLYCYVGRADQNALEKSEIDITAITNNSINQITSTKNTSLTEINITTEEGINRLNTDSNALNRTQITNCITEIPQDIKLELNDGTLTLKAGSKVYVPNGAGVFDEIVISNDIQHTSTVSGTAEQLLFYRKTSNSINCHWNISDCFSGTTTPSQSTYIFYNTSSNIIRYCVNSTVYNEEVSLPIAKIKMTDGVFTSIDQVFNGFGYIGSLTYALPKVKGLIPNGRNADGTMNNLEYTTPSVIIRDWGAEGYTGPVHYWLMSNNILSNTGKNYHISPDGYLIDDYRGNRISGFVCADGYRTAGKITTFNMRQPITIPDTASNHYFYEWKGLTAVSSVQNYTINFTCRRGNPIFISFTGDANPINGNGWSDYRLLKNDTLKARMVTDCSAESKNMPFCLTYLDTDVIAGNTYTYTFRIRESGSGTINFQEGGDVEAPKIIIYEL